MYLIGTLLDLAVSDPEEE